MNFTFVFNFTVEGGEGGGVVGVASKTGFRLIMRNKKIGWQYFLFLLPRRVVAWVAKGFKDN